MSARPFVDSETTGVSIEIREMAEDVYEIRRRGDAEASRDRELRGDGAPRECERDLGIGVEGLLVFLVATRVVVRVVVRRR